MARSSFAAGVVVGGLGGVVLGYLVSRNHPGVTESAPIETIDLTPSIKRRRRASAGSDTDQASAPRKEADKE